MRIISGSARGCKLAEFSGSGIRPTPDRVREAIFSILLSRFASLHEFKILDLCAGTGAMSLEALSRGARHALMVDSSPQAARLIADNLKRCKMTERAALLKQTAEASLPSAKSQGPFDIIFMDPPYNQGRVPVLLETIAALQLLKQNGIISAETATGERFEIPAALTLIDVRRYGSTEIHLLCNRIPPDAYCEDA